MASLKKQIVEVLDKSTNNGMNADEILGIIETASCTNEYLIYSSVATRKRKWPVDYQTRSKAQ